MPFLFIFSGTSLFLLGAVLLPIMTVAWEQDQTEKESFLVPGAHEIVVEAPTVLGLYDLSITHPSNRILWDKLRLRAGLSLVNQSSGEMIPMVENAKNAKGKLLLGEARNEKEELLQSNSGGLGFFIVERPGTYLLIVPEEILPEEVTKTPVYWSLRIPPDYHSSVVGAVFLSFAVFGAFLSGLGVLMLVLPRFKKNLDNAVPS